MRKIYSILVLVIVNLFSPSAQSALINGSVLQIDAGSYFRIEVVPGTWIDTQISGHDGLLIGSTQSASGSHSGVPDGSENPGIDEPWEFFGNTGMHQTVSPVNVLNDDANGQVQLDFSGWTWIWNGIDNYDGSLLPGYSGSGTSALLSCAIDCSNGDSFTLEFNTAYMMWWLDTGNVGAMPYQLHLEGTVSAVPLPGAYWLFLSGFFYLVRVAGNRAVIQKNRH